ncbi:MAG: hypothetical protein QM490_05570 [Candidatus Gracilibacteria bacterium]
MLENLSDSVNILKSVNTNLGFVGMADSVVFNDRINYLLKG